LRCATAGRAAQFINNYLPLPNNPTVANPNQYTFKQPNITSQGQLTLRGDQMPKQNRLEMRYYRFNYNIGELLPQPGNVNYAAAGNLGEVDNAALILTTTITPHLVNLLSYGYAHTYTHPGAPRRLSHTADPWAQPLQRRTRLPGFFNLQLCRREWSGFDGLAQRS
jgi:hypothetical protein